MKILDFCIKHNTSYRVYKTLTGEDHLSALTTFTLHKNKDEVISSINLNNSVLRAINKHTYL